MKSRKRIVLIVLFVLLGIVDIFVYWNIHLYTRAKKTEDSRERLKILLEAKKVYPFNDRVYYEMGKSHFVSGIRNAEKNLDAGAYMTESAESFRRSLRLNPSSPFGHFYYAQALQYEDLFTPSSHSLIDKEFMSAAQLAGENRLILYEVGKRLLVRWNDLSAEERDFILKILGRALEWKPADKFPSLMHIWEMNVGDIGIMERIMPQNPQIYSAFGNFLGEKSLSLPDRHRMLSRADILFFERAKSLLDAGKREFEAAKYSDAKRLLTYCLGNLLKVRFFTRLSGEYPIDGIEYSDLYAAVNLYLALSILESGDGFEESRKYLHGFLEIEERAARLNELEAFLRRHRITDPALWVHLYHRQERYEEMAKVADQIREGQLDRSKMSRENLPRMFYFLGNAFQRKGRLVEAVEFFKKSLDADSRYLEPWLSLRQNYRRLNEVEKIQEVEARINRILAPKEMVFSDLVLSKSREFSRGLILEGKQMRLDLYFERIKKDFAPLITVEFNGQVIGEDYPEDGRLSFPVEPEMGENILVIKAVNHPFFLRRMTFEARADEHLVLTFQDEELDFKFTP